MLKELGARWIVEKAAYFGENSQIIVNDFVKAAVFHLEGGGALGFPPPSDQFPPPKILRNFSIIYNTK